MFSEYFMWSLNFLQGLTGSYAFAIIFFTIIIKVLLYPLTEKQYRSMKEMQALQPEIRKLQERFKDDQKKLQEKQMELFAKHKINPLGGCFPLLIQMPILIGIYSTIISFKNVFAGEHLPFLWIGGFLSERYPDWFASDLSRVDMPLLILYGVSMYLSQKLTVTDPSTAQSQKSMNTFMPIFFTFMLLQMQLPCAMVLYWLCFNLLGLIQQAHIIRMPDAVLVTDAEDVAVDGESSKTKGSKKR